MQERYPKLEKDIQAVLIQFVSSVADQNSPIMSNVKSHVIHEGQSSAILRPSGERESINMRSFSTESIISKDTILYGKVDEIAEALRPVGEAIATDKEKVMFEALHESTKASGNVVDAKGRPLSLELLLEVLEKIQIDFDIDGQAQMPTMVVAPSMMQKIHEMSTGPDADEYQRKFDELIKHKKAEWRAREADRILVG